MRKIFTLIAAVIIIGSAAKSQYVNIPDSNFRRYLQTFYSSCVNASGQLDTTCSQLLNATVIRSFNSYSYSIQTLDGIQYFKNLDTLELNAPNLTAIPALPPSLRYFSARYISLVTLGMLPATLTYLDLFSTKILSLPPLPNSLEYLDCTNNDSLTNLPLLPPALRHLNITGCTRLQQLPALPGNLIYFDCMSCSNLQRLPVLSNTSLRLLRMGFSSNITNIPALPPTVRFLDIRSCPSLLALPDLPDSLRTLICSYLPGLTSLPVLPALLDTLMCVNDSLTALPLINNTLKVLYCQQNQLTTLPTLPSSIQRITCDFNPITSLPAFPISLTYLACNAAQLTSLPALPSQLEELSVSGNQLTTLPALPVSLKRLSCSGNTLTSLPPLPAGLTGLWCHNNRLTNLPELPASMELLFCSNNQLRSLPALPATMRYLVCGNGQLSSLPALPDTMYLLSCVGSNLFCLPELPRFGSGGIAFSLYVDTSRIRCIPNITNAVNFTINDMPATSILPVCNPLNNRNQCTAFPQLHGTVFIDNNNNNILDAGEQVKSNTKLLLSNGNYTFTDSAGHYEIGADDLGTYSLSLTAPRYYRYAPSSYNYIFNSYDTLVTGNFALQIDTTIDELTIRITPINWAARPGFSFPYMISYENTGTTTLSPNIVFDYDQTKLDYNTSSVAGVLDNTNTLAYSPGAMAPGENGSLIGYFTLKTTVPLGDTLHAKATITASTFTTYDSVQTNVRGAFDPNDKQATPQLSPSQVANGQFIDYTIRFQNTGTDTAFNVVLSDTLNENLQAGTLEMLLSSHNCKTTVKGNIVFFEFLNILLPDSNVNEKASHGFVSFRIKPQTTVLPNTTIPNKAAIYFDYNAPVITNIAGTLIKDFTVIPLKLVSFSAVPQNDNTVSLYWNTANEINTKQFVIEKGSDGLRFSAITNVAAKGKATNDYYAAIADANTGIQFYRLKIVDNDGTFTYSPVIKIDRRKNAAGFSVLTNPVKDFIIINTTDKSLNNTQGSIINTQGATVRSFIIKEGSQTVAIKGLPAGIYYLRTMNGSSKVAIQ